MGIEFCLAQRSPDREFSYSAAERCRRTCRKRLDIYDNRLGSNLLSDRPVIIEESVKNAAAPGRHPYLDKAYEFCRIDCDLALLLRDKDKLAQECRIIYLSSIGLT